MFEQSAASLHAMSCAKNHNGFKARPGQVQLTEWLVENGDTARRLCVRWPGGYGKTAGIALAYELMRQSGRVTRLLAVVANDQQRTQFRRDFPAMCRRIGFQIKGDCVWEFDKTARALRTSNNDTCEVFVTTIQMVSATNRKGTDSLMDLLGDGNSWMLAADEYHHYAQEKDWGKSLQRVCDKVEFSLAMSATPTRDGASTIFGEPDLTVTYREAVEQNAVKKLYLRKYHYAVQATTRDGVQVEYTTDDLRQQLEKESLNDFEERRGLRYNAQYIYPMILEPLFRLGNRRMASGKPLQCLIRTMSCLHAKFICEFVQEVFPAYRVAWVGSGPNGQPDHVNQAVIEKFAPALGKDPEIDVLVQVQMVGEGTDSIMVCEMIDLSIAHIDGASNQTKQFIFRGSRVIPGLSHDQQYCNVNVPSDAKLAGLEQDDNLIGVSLMDWIDGDYSKAGADSQQDVPPSDPEFMPAPQDFLSNVVCRKAELTEVTGERHQHFMNFVANMNANVVNTAWHWDVENNPEHREAATAAYLKAGNEHAAKMDKQAQLELRAQKFNDEVGRLAAAGAKIMQRENGTKTTKELIGKLTKALNGELKRRIGCPREAWIQEDFDHAGKILHDYGCIISDRLKSSAQPLEQWGKKKEKGDLPWLN